jgi:hypothetical protein
MAEIHRNGEIVETATEARQGERGQSVLSILAYSIGGTAVILLGLYFAMAQ